MNVLDNVIIFEGGALFGAIAMAAYIFTLLRLRMGRWWWET